MTTATTHALPRLLIVDDNPSIHEDIKKVLGTRESDAGLDALETELFGPDAAAPAAPRSEFEIDDAFQGEEALRMVRAAVAERRPYAVVFLDVRMPPGWSGVETMRHLSGVDPDLLIVLCTAYADFSWSEISAACPHPERLLVLKKPFDTIELTQIAHALAAQWAWVRIARDRLDALRSEVDLRCSQIATLGRRRAEEAAALLLALPRVDQDVGEVLDAAEGIAGLAGCYTEAVNALEQLGQALDLVKRVRTEEQAASLERLSRRLLDAARRTREELERVKSIAQAGRGPTGSAA